MAVIAHAMFDGKQVDILGFDHGRVIIQVEGKYEFVPPELLEHSHYPGEDKEKKEVPPPSTRGRVRVSDQP